MDEKERYQKAEAFATEKHKGQFLHWPRTIYYASFSGGGNREKSRLWVDYQITALFHDLLEDTDATEEEIFDLGGARVLEAVRLLTKQEGYVMAEYVAGVRSNPIAFVVKAADRLHNLRTAFCTDEAFRRAYVLETRQWYMDFSDEIKEAAEELAKTVPDFTKTDSVSVDK